MRSPSHTPEPIVVARIPSVVTSVVPVCVFASVPGCVLPSTPCVTETPCVEEAPRVEETACVSNMVCVSETPCASGRPCVSGTTCAKEMARVSERVRVSEARCVRGTACVRSLSVREMTVGMRERAAASPSVSVLEWCVSFVTRRSAWVECQRRRRQRDKGRVAAVAVLGTVPGLHGSEREVQAVQRTRPPRARLRE